MYKFKVIENFDINSELFKKLEDIAVSAFGKPEDREKLRKEMKEFLPGSTVFYNDFSFFAIKGAEIYINFERIPAYYFLAGVVKEKFQGNGIGKRGMEVRLEYCLRRTRGKNLIIMTSTQNPIVLYNLIKALEKYKELGRISDYTIILQKVKKMYGRQLTKEVPRLKPYSNLKSKIQEIFNELNHQEGDGFKIYVLVSKAP